uniref:TAF8 RNA polymerase II, TATA box binding protein (TBP)-associated factor n=1 Tax=Cyprinus carpio TaxID=7962 RepID=A0A8C1SFU6_CYPCA
VLPTIIYHHVTSPTENYQLARRRTLQVVVSSLLTECGFEQTYITEAGRCAKATCEHTVNSLRMHFSFHCCSFPLYFNVNALPDVLNAVLSSQVFSSFSRIIAYIILKHGQNFHFGMDEDVSDYQVVREKAESQRRDVERALTRFMAKTGETESLFKDDISAFPLIAAKPSTIPYLSALLPSELELQTLEETDSSEQDDQTDTENNSSNVSQASMNKAPNPKLLPGRRSINGCPLLSVCVHGVCVFTAVCVHFGWVKSRARFPSMGYHTWLYVTSLSLSLFCFQF